MRAGLIIARDGSDIEHENKYDSRLTKLTLDPDADPVHFDVITLSGGTKWTISPSDTTLHEEALFRVKHNLPFKPQFSAYFYTVGLTSTLVSQALKGMYAINQSLMVFNAVSLGDEWVEADADNQYFYIYHRARATGYGTDPWTTEGSNFTYRIRYFIFNQPGYMYVDGDTQRAQ